MKKTILAMLAAIACTMPAMAQTFANGYYRVSNNQTGRYIYIEDNKGSLNYQKASADMAAILLRKGLDRAVYDPASVLYLEAHGSRYDIQAQSTGIYSLISSYVNIMESPKVKGTYWAYGSNSGVTLYLYDYIKSSLIDESYLETSGYDECRNWLITPIDANTDNYFGVKPTIKAGEKYYEPFFASFPFSCASTGMKVYYIYKVDEANGIVAYKEITGVVPPATPVIIECSSQNPADNKLNLGGTAAAVNGNLAQGVYFNYHEYKHENYVTYNKSTMRLLGVNAEGQLAAVQSTEEYVPRNTFYLPVAASVPANIRLVSEEEYNDIISNGINDIEIDATNAFDAYTIMGVKVDAKSVNDLAPGFYIINGEKVYIRK